MGEANRLCALRRWARPGERERQSAGMKASPNVRAHLARMHAAQKGRVCTPETRAKISAANRGIKRSAKFRAQILRAVTARWARPRERETQGARRKGRRHSPDARAKMSAVAVRRYQNPDERAKTSAATTGRKMPPCTPEWRAHLSTALKTSPRAQAHRARLGRVSPTRIEIQLKNALDAAGVEYVFQFPVPGTPYTADFYLPLRNTILEADGEYWHSRPQTRIKDARRDAIMSALGYRVVRLGEHQIHAIVPASVMEILR